MPIPNDYAERVYAGVLGKIIGVYLGRPIEGWSYQRIVKEIGDVAYYVHGKIGVPLIVTDDDISGTFTFLRALPDHGNRRDITAEQIGNTWMNYLIENRTILWWGGMGNSTEHTAYLRLKAGIKAPGSGSIALNGKVVAEQIGAQIFIDGWAMVAPGDPKLAAELAAKAATVSHDGEAKYGAQLLAAMEAMAFVETDIEKLTDAGLAVIPKDCLIAALVADIRAWKKKEPDWRKTRDHIESEWGYDRYAGNCHMIPNHALLHLAFQYCDGDFSKALLIVNTAGWDTDCNSANVGCLMGIRGGLAGLEGKLDWRGPVADRMYLPTADGGRAITDALTEAYHIVNAGRALAGQAPDVPKGGARFHFSLPGAVQGWRPMDPSVDEAAVENVARAGSRGLAIRFKGLTGGQAARVVTDTFIPPEASKIGGYGLIASPTLYPGQVVRAKLDADAYSGAPVTARLFVRAYGAKDEPVMVHGPDVILAPGAEAETEWRVPDLAGAPVFQVGLELAGAGAGTVHLLSLGWEGAPDVTLGRPKDEGKMWLKAWVDGADHFERDWVLDVRLMQDHGRGLVSQGTREWCDYRAGVTLVPHLMDACGLAVRVQGMRRYYALVLTRESKVRLVKMLDHERLLAEAPCPVEFGGTYELALEAKGDRLLAFVGGVQVFDARDPERSFNGGGVGLIVEVGRLHAGPVTIRPA
ncbi:MAG: ADP-ribosylglycohydrolase family protein [Candidatus Coatesbacteria bacterium]